MSTKIIQAQIITTEPHNFRGLDALLKSSDPSASIQLQSPDTNFTNIEPSIIFLDHTPPSHNAFETLSKINGSRQGVPAVFLLPADQTYLAQQAFTYGATDYLIKDIEHRYIELLPPLIHKIQYAQQFNYAQLVEQAGDSIIVVGLDGKITFANTAAARLTEYSVSELLNLNLFDLIAPDSRDMVFAFCETQVRHRPISDTIEFPIITCTGETCWIEKTVTLLEDPSGNLQFHGIARDITKRKLAEFQVIQRTAELEILTQVAISVATTLDSENILYEVARLSCYAVHASSAYICSVDLDKGEMTVIAEYLSQYASEKERASDLYKTYDFDNDFPSMREWIQNPSDDFVAHIDDPDLEPF